MNTRTTRASGSAMLSATLALALGLAGCAGSSGAEDLDGRSLTYVAAPDQAGMPKVGDCFADAFYDHVPDRAERVPCDDKSVFQILAAPTDGNITFDRCDELLFDRGLATEGSPEAPDDYGATVLVPSEGLRNEGTDQSYCIGDRAP